MAHRGPIVAHHGPDQHGPGNITVANVQRDRLAEPGTGLENVGHRVLTYSQLRNVKPMADTREPSMRTLHRRERGRARRRHETQGSRSAVEHRRHARPGHREAAAGDRDEGYRPW